MAEPGRNDPCICGSGKKFKNCCLGKEKPANYAFSQHSSRELLKVFALLLLQSRNHGKNIRIEQAILDAFRHTSKNTKDLDLVQLRTDLLKYCIPHPYEDPPVEFFTEILYWHNGNHLVFPGVAGNGVEIVQRLLNTIRIPSKLPKQFLEEIEPIIRFLLSIHDRIALTLGYTPRLFEDEHREPLFIPNDSFVQKHKGLFSFRADAMSNILKHFNLSLHTFNNFVCDIGNKNLNFENPDDNPLFQRPFVLMDDEYILVDPTAELFCLNDFILETAKKHSCLEVLLDMYRDEGMVELYPVFMRMGWERIEFNFPKDGSLPKSCRWTELLFSIDVGRLAYVAVMTETPVLQTDLEKAIKEYSGELESRAEKIGGLIKDKFYEHQLLFLHVIQKTRILSKVGLSLNLITSIDFHLFFSYEELFLLTRKWKFDHLTLWKYAKYLQDYENARKFAPYNTHFSKMKWYFDNEESFHHSDKMAPSVIFFEFEMESEVRRSAIQLLDRKAIPYLSQGKISFVPCYRKEEHYPVYISQDINQGVIANCLLEYDCAIWCMSSRESDSKGDIYINGILYWLHEMFGIINGWMNQLDSAPVLMLVTFENGLHELGVEIKFEENLEINFGYKIVAEERRIDLFIPIALRSYLYTAGNRGEYFLMDFIIDVIGELQEQLNVGKRLAADVKDRIFGEIMPDGPKKFINTLTDYRDLTLTPVDIDKPRIVPKADISYVLQNQVGGLNREIPIGKISEPKNQKVFLNEIVLYHYKKIKDLVAEYDGLSLLMFLMRRQESLLQDYAFRQVNYPVKQACYSHYYNVFEEFFETAKDGNAANLALRILIEWVACWMPTGKKLPSNDDIDILLAHICQVLNYGSLSDEIEYGLREIEIGLLPSGRLGVDRKKNITYNAMGDKVFGAEYYGLSEKFQEYFKYPNHQVKDPIYGKYVANVEDVFRTEWGIGIHDVFTLTYELVRELFGQGHSVILISKTELLSLLIKLKYTPVEIEGWLNVLRFIKRSDVLKAPEGYKKEEVRPWRYNRRISYLLKPLIFVEKDREDHILISTRHLYKAAENLVSLFHNGKLPLDKENKSIRRLLAERNAIKGKEYRDEVLQWLTGNTHLIVYPQEITIKKKGFFVADTDKGDIDILAIDHERKIIYSIECKNTSQSKVAYEFHLEIIEYLGQPGKVGLIQKHVNRDLWLLENREQVLQKLKLGSDYKILSLVISNHLLPTAFLRTIPIATISFYELKQSGLPIFGY